MPYFVWQQTTKGTTTCSKRDELPMNPETKSIFKTITVFYCSITEEEYKLSLDELAKIYPCPEV